jgi:hypothetical protein
MKIENNSIRLVSTISESDKAKLEDLRGDWTSSYTVRQLIRDKHKLSLIMD